MYSVRRGYESETEDKRPKKILEFSPRKYDGIGPVTKEGIPIVLRSVSSFQPIYTTNYLFIIRTQIIKI